MPDQMHSYNHGLVTSMKGPALEAVRVTGLNNATCTVAEQCRSGFIKSVTKTGTGEYTFTLSLPYPPAIIICIPKINQAAVTDDILTARYDAASYSASAGTFVVHVANDDDSGAPVAADGGATDELHVLMMFRRYTT